VKRRALRHGIPVRQPGTLKDAPELDEVRQAKPDAVIVAAYGLLLPAQLLEAGRFGALNIHASLLPRWRGAAPIQRALLAGDPETGISIMQMDAGLDTGPVLLRMRVPIAAGDDAGSLHDKLAAAGADAIVAALAGIEAGRVTAVAQSDEGVTYARKIDKRETRLAWSLPAAQLERAVRAFRPAPGAYALLEEEPVKIWRAEALEGKGSPGAIHVTEGKLVVACGEGALAISELQRAGGRRLGVPEFLRGRSLPPGAQFT
jgi:methionyl-tRNA formyltransferase